MDTHMKTRELFDTSCNNNWVYKTRIKYALILHRTAIGKRGFTLIELIMVVALIAVLATLSLSSFANLKTNAKNGRCKAEIRTLEKSILASFTDKGHLPTALTRAEIGSDADVKDPWGHPYVYYDIASGLGTPYTDINTDDLNTDFDLYSMGQDGATATNLVPDPVANVASFDDIVRCNDGSTVELGKDRNGAI
jgi:general secretion pathway protein G